MPYPQLATPVAVDNGRRLVLERFQEIHSNPDDPETVVAVQVTISLRSLPATNRPIGTYLLTVQNGQSDELRLRPPAEFLPGMVFQDVLEVRRNQVSTPTGLDQVLAAWRGGAVGARKVATLTALGLLGAIDQATLAPSL